MVYNFAGDRVTKGPREKIDFLPINTKMSRLEFIDDEARARFYSGEVRELICRGLNLVEIPELPEGLEILNVGKNTGLKQLPKLPEGLRELYMHKCELIKLPKLPKSLVALSLQNTRLLWGVRFPKRIEALTMGHGYLENLDLLDNLRILICLTMCIDNFRVPRNLRVLSLHSGCQIGEKLKLEWFPPTLELLDIDCEGIREMRNLPNSLRYLRVGKDLCCELVLPEGLEAFVCYRNTGLRELPPLPASLKLLDISDSKISRLPSLPDGLRILFCQDTKVTTLPPLPAGLEQLNLNRSCVSGELEIPANMRRLWFGETAVRGVKWRGGVIPPLKWFIGYTSQLRQMPPLPEDIDYINVANCRLKGAWRGYFTNLSGLWCRTNKLTELPSIARAATLQCDENRLAYLPDVVLVPSVTCSCSGNPSDGDTPMVKWFPSLRELCGAVVYPQWLNQRIGIVELDEYLAKFCRCPGCEKMAHVERKFARTEAGLRVAAWMCHQCRPGERRDSSVPTVAEIPASYSNYYFNEAVYPYLTRENNAQQWFNIRPLQD
jgi:hypothetical protein